MREIQFKVAAQVLEVTGDVSNIVPGTSGYLEAHFDFSEEGADCVKVASFFSRGKEYAELVTDDKCVIPAEALTSRYFKVQVIGVKRDYRILTNKVKIVQEG